MTFRLTIAAADIQRAVNACAQVIEPSGKIPILKCIRIHAAGGQAMFIGTNTDQTIIAGVPGDGSGVACIDSQALSVKVNALRNDAVLFEEWVSPEGARFVNITQGRTKWKVPVLLDDFPVSVAEPVEGDAVTVGKEFATAIKAAQGAVLQAASNSYGAVWLDGQFVAAADGRQLRVIKVDADMRQTLLLPNAASKVIALFPDGADVVLSERLAQFSRGGLTLITRLVEGTPMDWRRGVIGFEASAVNSCEVDTADFLAAIRRASSIKASGEKSGAFINMQIRFRADQVEIFTRNADGEEGDDAAACVTTGADGNVGLSGGLLLSAVESLACERLRIRYGIDRDPIIVNPVGRDGEDFRVIMPRQFT